MREESETGAVLDAISRARRVGTKEMILGSAPKSTVPATKSFPSSNSELFVGRIDRELASTDSANIISFDASWMHERDVVDTA